MLIIDLKKSTAPTVQYCIYILRLIFIQYCRNENTPSVWYSYSAVLQKREYTSRLVFIQYLNADRYIYSIKQQEKPKERKKLRVWLNFLVKKNTKLIKGTTIGSNLRSPPMPIKECVTLFISVADLNIKIKYVLVLDQFREAFTKYIWCESIL